MTIDPSAPLLSKEQQFWVDKTQAAIASILSKDKAIKQDIRAKLQAQLRVLWAGMSSWSDAEAEAFVAQVTPLVEAAQEQAARVTAAATSELIDGKPVTLSAADVTGPAVRGGAPLSEVYMRPIVASRVEFANLVKQVGADLALDQVIDKAIDIGLNRLLATADTDVTLAANQAQKIICEQKGVKYLRRYASTAACGFCQKAAEHLYWNVYDLAPLHPHCRCYSVPVKTRFGTAPDPTGFDPDQYLASLVLNEKQATAKAAKLAKEDLPDPPPVPVQVKAATVLPDGGVEVTTYSGNTVVFRSIEPQPPMFHQVEMTPGLHGTKSTAMFPQGQDDPLLAFVQYGEKYGVLPQADLDLPKPTKWDGPVPTKPKGYWGKFPAKDAKVQPDGSVLIEKPNGDITYYRALDHPEPGQAAVQFSINGTNWTTQLPEPDLEYGGDFWKWLKYAEIEGHPPGVKAPKPSVSSKPDAELGAVFTGPEPATEKTLDVLEVELAQVKKDALQEYIADYDAYAHYSGGEPWDTLTPEQQASVIAEWEENSLGLNPKVAGLEKAIEKATQAPNAGPRPKPKPKPKPRPEPERKPSDTTEGILQDADGTWWAEADTEAPFQLPEGRLAERLRPLDPPTSKSTEESLVWDAVDEADQDTIDWFAKAAMLKRRIQVQLGGRLARDSRIDPVAMARLGPPTEGGVDGATVAAQLKDPETVWERLPDDEATRLGRRYRAVGKVPVDSTVDLERKFGPGATRLNDDVIEDYVQWNTSNLVQQWAQTSGDSHHRAIAMQIAARDEFDLGLDDAGQVRLPGGKSDHGQRNDYNDPDLQAQARLFLAQQYDQTQDFLEEQGIKSLRLYRGMKLPPDHPPVKRGEVISMKMQPMSSWSTHIAQAAKFSGSTGIIMMAIVPRNRIIGSPRTGYGCRAEQEFVVLGGVTRALVVRAP